MQLSAALPRRLLPLAAGVLAVILLFGDTTRAFLALAALGIFALATVAEEIVNLRRELDRLRRDLTAHVVRSGSVRMWLQIGPSDNPTEGNSTHETS